MTEATTEQDFVHPFPVVVTNEAGEVESEHGWLRVVHDDRRVLVPGVRYPALNVIKVVEAVDYLLPGWPEEWR